MTERKLLELLLEKITSMEKEIKVVRDTMATKEEVTGVKEELTEMKTNLTSVNEELSDVKNLVSDIPALKVAVLETKDAVNRIENIQEQHERTLDLLSRRSIDQEAELKRIK